MKQITFHDFAQQGKEINNIQKQIEENRFVHAVLISGEPGTGKKTLAALIAKTLLCSADSDRPCGICDNCHLSEAGEHPDQIIIQKGVPLSTETKTGKSTVPVSDIREVIKICNRHTFKSRNRVIIIPDAENMTIQAQNCLLKILEEPPLNTFFILTTSKPSDLLITIKSRCRPIKLIPWDTAYIRTLLIEYGVPPERSEIVAVTAGGSIGKSLQLASDEDYWGTRNEIFQTFFSSVPRSDVLRASSLWKERKEDAEIVFCILENAVHSLLKYRLNLIFPPDGHSFSEEWMQFGRAADLERFAFLFDCISDARKRNASNVNFQAVFEQLHLAFIGECAKWIK